MRNHQALSAGSVNAASEFSDIYLPLCCGSYQLIRRTSKDMDKTPEPILVTGGAGFIGSNFVLKWVDAGGGVVNLDLHTYAGNPANLASLDGNPHHLMVHGDICDAELVSGLLREHRPQAIVHFAAESHVDRSI